MEERRVITSAISDMSVAEVRKALASIRKTWEETLACERSRPMYMSDEALVQGCSVQEFSFRFVLGHHEKRLSKTRNASTAAMREQTECTSLAA